MTAESATINPQTLEMLRCPISHSALAQAGPELLAGINERIAAGGLNDRSGNSVSVAMQSALVNSDSSSIYPVRGGILRLVESESIAWNVNEARKATE